MSAPFLKLENVSKAFPGVQALSNVSLEINKGEIHCLVGENGAGKSTLIKLLTGVHAWDSGTVFFNGQTLHNLTPQKALHELGIVPIYQELNLIPKLDVAENIFLGVRSRHERLRSSTARDGQTNQGDSGPPQSRY